MRIFHAIDSCDPTAGGVAEAVLRLSQSLGELGASSGILCGNDPQDTFLENVKGEIHAFGPSRFGRFGYVPAMRSWLQEHEKRMDALILHGLWQYPGVAGRVALRGTDTPYYVYPHGMLDPWFKETYPAKHFRKTIFWKLIQSKIIREARSVCFTTEEERVLAQRTFSPYDCRESVVGLGAVEPDGDADSQIHSFYQQFPHARDRRKFLFLARIHPKKGADLLLRAFAENASSEDLLVLAGPCEDETYADTLHELATHCGDRVLWTGMLEGDSKWGALRSAEALILPSHQENFGIVVAEALAVGTPVLISNKVNLWREVEQDGAGAVADDNLSGTRWLLNYARETGLSKERARARACFDKRFSIRRGAANLLALIEADASA